MPPHIRWFNLSNNDDKSVSIYIYDEIGFFAVEARDVIEQIRDITADLIHLHINSPGGSIYHAQGIYNALRQHKAKVITHIDGMAASAASWVALAGDEVHIAANGLVMIHDPMTIMLGNAAELRKEADVLDKFGESIAGIIAERTGNTREDVLAKMHAEIWFDANQAKEYGFATHVVEEKRIAASFDLSRFKNAPADVLARMASTSASHISNAARLRLSRSV